MTLSKSTTRGQSPRSACFAHKAGFRDFSVRYSGIVVSRSCVLAPGSWVRLTILLAPLALAGELLGQPILSQVVSDDPLVRQTALKKMAALTVEQRLAYLPELTRMIRENNGYRVAPALAKIGPMAVPYLIRLVESSDAYVRTVAVRSLGMMRPALPETLKVFRGLLSDVSVQRDAAVSLLSLGIEDERARSLLMHLGKAGPAAVSSREAFLLGYRLFLPGTNSFDMMLRYS